MFLSSVHPGLGQGGEGGSIRTQTLKQRLGPVCWGEEEKRQQAVASSAPPSREAGFECGEAMGGKEQKKQTTSAVPHFVQAGEGLHSAHDEFRKRRGISGG